MNVYKGLKLGAKTLLWAGTATGYLGVGAWWLGATDGLSGGTDPAKEIKSTNPKIKTDAEILNYYTPSALGYRERDNKTKVKDEEVDLLGGDTLNYKLIQTYDAAQNGIFNSGFFAAAYEHIPTGSIVVSFPGANFNGFSKLAMDILPVLKSSAGLQTSQIDEAVDFVNLVKKNHCQNSKEISLVVGHSLGSYNANFIAASGVAGANVEYCIFDGAGLNEIFIRNCAEKFKISEDSVRKNLQKATSVVWHENNLNGLWGGSQPGTLYTASNEPANYENVNHRLAPDYHFHHIINKINAEVKEGKQHFLRVAGKFGSGEESPAPMTVTVLMLVAATGISIRTLSKHATKTMDSAAEKTYPHIPENFKEMTQPISSQLVEGDDYLNKIAKDAVSKFLVIGKHAQKAINNYVMNQQKDNGLGK